jgi:hypothetical protein
MNKEDTANQAWRKYVNKEQAMPNVTINYNAHKGGTDTYDMVNFYSDERTALNY